MSYPCAEGYCVAVVEEPLGKCPVHRAGVPADHVDWMVRLRSTTNAAALEPRPFPSWPWRRARGGTSA